MNVTVQIEVVELGLCCRLTWFDLSLQVVFLVGFHWTWCDRATYCCCRGKSTGCEDLEKLHVEDSFDAVISSRSVRQ